MSAASPDWGHAYERTQCDTAQRLRDLRARGAARYAFGDSAPSDLAPCDPSRLNDRQIGDLARLHAERTVNRAINVQAEQDVRARTAR